MRLEYGLKGGRKKGRQKKRWKDNIRVEQARSSPCSKGLWRTEENGCEKGYLEHVFVLDWRGRV